MKKLALCIILLLSIFIVTACKKEDFILSADEVTSNTILMKQDGSLQVALVESFDKTYYSLSELEEFVMAEINKYNKEIGSEVITMLDRQLNNGNAVIILNYAGMGHYATFNNVIAAYFNTNQATDDFPLPDSFVSAKDRKPVSLVKVLDSKFKVLAIEGAYDIIVEGNIKYYTDNAKLINNNKVQSNDDGLSVVVYKP
ncbi:MAG: hypothetical protein GX288_09280 [Clostridiales bacterium]|jgi:hypothetical protein|nr:hypothetical protein [Clostridiales bacterium]